MRRIASVLAIATGLVLVALPLGYSMFGRTADAERILDRFTFLTLGDNPQRYLDEAVVTRDGSSQLVERAIPALATESGVAQAELDARSPALVEAQQTVPEARDFSVRYSEQLEAVQDKFQSVYDIPSSSLPLTAVPFFFVIVGLAAIALGAIALRTASRAPLIAIAALGALLFLGPIAFGGISKSADGEDVKDFAGNGLTERAATAAEEASSALDQLVAETEQSTLPFLASAQGVPVGQLDGELAADYPEAAAFLADWETIGPRLSRLADAVSASVVEFEAAERLPIAFPVWVLLAAGLLLAGSAGVALLGAPSELRS
jgi:hypothetical protein